MQKVSSLVSKDIGNYLANRATWSIVYVLGQYATGNGTTDDAGSINALITTIGSDEATIVVDPGTYRCGAAVTVPSNITLWFLQGGMLYPDSGITITINGPLEAGVFQIFAGSGTIAGAIKVDSLHPEWYPGTDAEKVSTVITAAIAQDKSVKFSRMYDITGSTITINKPSSNRTILSLLGEGGGIRKDDVGSVFTATSTDMGDIVSANMMYKSTTGINTVIWDCDKLIRIVSSQDSYISVDTVVRANTRWTQSIRFSHCTITGGSGWAFEWARSFDVTINDCTIEHRVNGIRNTVFTGNPDNDNLRIVNNVIEGLSGQALDLGSSFACVISGNYMEANTGGYFVFDTSANYHNGLTIIGNSVQQSASQITADTPAIDLKGIGNNGVFSSGNTATGVLYKLYADGTNGRLVSIGDMSYNDKKVINSTNQLVEFGRLTAKTSPTGIQYGRTAIYQLASEATSFTAGEIKEITISATGITLSAADLVTAFINAVSGSTSVQIHHYRFSTVANEVYVRVENNSAGTQNITVGVRVMQIK